MKDVPKIGDIRTHQFIVTDDHLATFESGPVHPVCSTFVLAREMEWVSRLFVLEFCDDNEEGVGTRLEIKHKSPAFVGDELNLSAKVNAFKKDELICEIEVKCGDRIIAMGSTGQKIMTKDKITQIFTSLD